MRTKLLAGVVVGLALVTAACGDDGDDPGAASTAASTEQSTDESTDVDTAVDTSADTSGTPDSTEPPMAESTDEASPDEEAYPSAIVSLSPTATEMLFAIEAGDRVLAVDDFSNYPPEAADKMVGISAFQPNVEAIAGLEPDLVITDGTNPDLLGQFDALGIAHWEGPAAVTFEDVYTQVEQLGAATGHVPEAAELVGQMQADVAAVVEGLPELDAPLTYYHELDDTYFSVTSDTFIGAVYAELGLVNIADATADGTPYPQLNAEYIIEQDPDLIFLACTKYCGITAESVAERPGWDGLTAVTTGGVIEMDDDVASRWGPRIVEYLQVAAAAVTDVAPAPAG